MSPPAPPRAWRGPGLGRLPLRRRWREEGRQPREHDRTDRRRINEVKLLLLHSLYDDEMGGLEHLQVLRQPLPGDGRPRAKLPDGLASVGLQSLEALVTRFIDKDARLTEEWRAATRIVTRPGVVNSTVRAAVPTSVPTPQPVTVPATVPAPVAGEVTKAA